MTEPLMFLRVLEGSCMAYFTLDIIVRLGFCPDKKRHLLNALTLLDVMSVMPFYIRELVKAIDHELEDTDGIYFLNALRMVLVFRILKLTRHFSGFKILGHTLKASAKELLLMILVLTIGVLTFACLIYYAEQMQESSSNDFRNIPRGYWWAVVTMTTLGYGDMFPRTMMGYIVGAICALCGLLMLALPVPVIVNNFTLYYSHAQAKLKLPKKTRNTLVGAADALKASCSDSDSSPPSINASQSSLSSEVVPPKPEVEEKMKIFAAEEKVSLDSGYKAGSPNNDLDKQGIRVIFTDEIEMGRRSKSPKGRLKAKSGFDNGGEDASFITIVVGGSRHKAGNEQGEGGNCDQQNTNSRMLSTSSSDDQKGLNSFEVVGKSNMADIDV